MALEPVRFEEATSYESILADEVGQGTRRHQGDVQEVELNRLL